MCLLDGENKIFTIIDFTIVLAIAITHLVFYFFIKDINYDNIYDTLKSSPLFDFSISNTTCGSKYFNVFHNFEGRKERSGGKTRRKKRIVDETAITKINGNYFCYRYISYKDLLYNDQIIHKGEHCQGDYSKDCGVIDTLDQHLCIKENEKCPLYDIGIGPITDTENYIYNESNSDVYYNKDNYDNPDKKIIGKLILNDGQPCYRINEKLWRKFDSLEAGEGLLECKLEISGKLTDDRYIKKGEITYRKIYEDNLSKENQDILFDDIKDEKVSLYQRQFLGIDKECNEKADFAEEIIEQVNDNQSSIKLCLLVESILLIAFWFILLVVTCLFSCFGGFLKKALGIIQLISNLLLIVLPLTFIICQGVFLMGINTYDLSYDCSDSITNEVFHKEHDNNLKAILYTGVSIGLDAFILIAHVISILIYRSRAKSEAESSEDFKKMEN